MTIAGASDMFGSLGSSQAARSAEAAANRSARAFWAWSSAASAERGRILGAMAAALDTGRDDLVDLAAIELGADPAWIDFNIDIAKAHLSEAGKILPHLADRTEAHADGRLSIVRRQAVGVVLSIVPWNAPIVLATRAIAAPLACGNTVLLKASERCPKTHHRLVELFQSAGLPDDVVNVVVSPGEESLAVARALIGHSAVRRITFTGSTRVGRLIAEEAAKVLKPCLLALSGKAPLIVLDDADLEAAATAAILGAFFNQGQVCMSTERIIVLDTVADAFVDRVLVKAKSLWAADPSLDTAPLGRLINAEAATRVSGLIEDAVAKGAVLRHGGETEGAVMQPAVLDHVGPAMRIYREESFGPVASLIRVRDAEEAVSVANDTEFGLAAAIFSRDTRRALALADRLETGICQINGPTVFDDPSMPFGGMKSSGYGRFGGADVIQEFTETRWLCHHSLTAPELETMLDLKHPRSTM